ncbi:hypothetical protein Hpoki81_07290 [Helicobacter pylori]
MSLAFEHFIHKMKKLDFSGDFLSVIRGLVFQNTPETLFFFFFEQQNAPLAQKSYQFMLY